MGGREEGRDGQKRREVEKRREERRGEERRIERGGSAARESDSLERSLLHALHFTLSFTAPFPTRGGPPERRRNLNRPNLIFDRPIHSNSLEVFWWCLYCTVAHFFSSILGSHSFMLIFTCHFRSNQCLAQRNVRFAHQKCDLRLGNGFPTQPGLQLSQCHVLFTFGHIHF